MSLKIVIFIFSFSLLTTLFAETKKVDDLFEKINQTSNPQEKKILIEKLKKKLAQENKKKQEEADAIVKAKEKVPQKPYREITIK